MSPEKRPFHREHKERKHSFFFFLPHTPKVTSTPYKEALTSWASHTTALFAAMI